MNFKTNQVHSVVFENVYKIFGEKNKTSIAIDNVSFSINAGELVTLLGPSGCGKTTILRMIAGLELPTKGRILIDNIDVTNLPATQRDVSMVFQSYALFPHMSVLENVSYGLTVSGIHKSEVEERAYNALSLVGMSDYAQRYPAELSGGQQQRVAIARALVLEPAVLLLDEPLSNLDAKLRRKVRTEIRDLQQKLKLTAVYVTHDQEEALAVSDTIIVMQKAQISQMGTPHVLYERPQNGFIADFIGGANLLRVDVLEVVGNSAHCVLDNYHFDVFCEFAQQGEALLAIKPETIHLRSLDVITFQVKDESNYLIGIVTHATYLGRYIEYFIEGSFGQFYVIQSAVVNPEQKIIIVGSSVAITFNFKGAIIVNGD